MELYLVNGNGYLKPLSKIKKERKNGEVLRLELYERDNDLFYCKYAGESQMKDDHEVCDNYKPRNKKSGCCINFKPAYSGSENFYELTDSGLTYLKQ